MMSAPGRAFASWIAARSVHLSVSSTAAAHVPLIFASTLSLVLLTTKGGSPTAAIAPVRPITAPTTSETTTTANAARRRPPLAGRGRARCAAELGPGVARGPGNAPSIASLLADDVAAATGGAAAPSKPG